MSILPFWEIYHTGDLDTLRMKEGRLKTTAAYTKTMAPETRRQMLAAGLKRNRRLLKEGKVPDMVESWP